MEGIRGQDIRVILSLKQGKPLLLGINSQEWGYYRLCTYFIIGVVRNTSLQTETKHIVEV